MVNPYDVDGVADAIAQAHAMPLAERRERWRAMLDTLRVHDITAWRRSFLDALSDVEPGTAAATAVRGDLEDPDAAFTPRRRTPAGATPRTPGPQPRSTG